MGKSIYNYVKSNSNSVKSFATSATFQDLLLILIAIAVIFGIAFILYKTGAVNSDVTENVNKTLTQLFLMFIYIVLVAMMCIFVVRNIFDHFLSTDKKDNHKILFGFTNWTCSIIITFCTFFFSFDITNSFLKELGVDNTTLTLVSLPVAFIIGLVIILILGLVLYLILWSFSDRYTSDSTAVTFRNKIKSEAQELANLITDISIDTVKAPLKFLSFIPNFFTSLHDFIIKEKNSVSNGVNSNQGGNNLNNKKLSNRRKMLNIINTAAFCFAIVSWFATAEGLKGYVFIEQSWRAYLLSFAIQSILFVLNLKLPKYFSKIGDDDTLQNNTLQNNTAQNNTLQNNTAQNNTSQDDKDDKKELVTKIISSFIWLGLTTTLIIWGINLSGSEHKKMFITVTIFFIVLILLAIINKEISKKIKQTVFVSFYILLLFSSSLFSFLCINMLVTKETRENNSNLILSKTYQKYQLKTEEYTNEYKKYVLTQIATTLSDLQEEYVKLEGGNTKSLDELKIELQNYQIPLNNLSQKIYGLNCVVYDENTGIFSYKDANYLQTNATDTSMIKEIEKYNALSIAAATDGYRENYKKIADSLLNGGEYKIINDPRGYGDSVPIIIAPKDSLNGREKINDIEYEVGLNVQFGKAFNDFQQINGEYNKKRNGMDSTISEILKIVLNKDFKEEDIKPYMEQLLNNINNFSLEEINSKGDFNQVILLTQKLQLLLDNCYIVNSDEKVLQPPENNNFSAINNEEKEQQKVTEILERLKDTWEKPYEDLENYIKTLPLYTEKEEASLVYNIETLKNYNKNDIIDDMEEVYRYNAENVNNIEFSFNRLFDSRQYNTLSWFSLGLALFFDIASLLAGLIGYWFKKKQQGTST
jgi:hypothetical protein